MSQPTFGQPDPSHLPSDQVTLVFGAVPNGSVLVQRRVRLNTLHAGYVDSLQEAGEDGRLGVQGWAVNSTLEAPQSILVVAEDQTLRTSDFRQFERPDVSAQLGLPGGVPAGFALYAHPRHECDRVRIFALFASGEIAEIPGAGEWRRSAPSAAPVTRETGDFARKFSVPIVAYPPDSPYAGVYSTASLYNRRPRGVTDQFLENAGTYHRKYTSHERWRVLLQTAFDRAGIDSASVSSVLDLGSGSGNSVVPALDILPSADIIATDISPQLLAILRNQLQPAQTGRCHLVVADASGQCFTEESFDIVIGAAILHHLFDPAEAIGSSAGALRKGGRAIFFEPFEAGNALLRCLYEELLGRREELRLDRAVAAMMENVIIDLKVRVGTDKSAPIFDSLDDKWLFSRHYFEAQRERFGFSSIDIFPLGTMDRDFSSQLTTHLRLCLDRPPGAVPPAAWDIVHRWDNSFSGDVKRDLLMEGCVVLTK